MVTVDFKKQLDSIGEEVKSSLSDSKCSNNLRRRLYSKVELLRLDIEESGDLSDDVKSKYFVSLDEIAKTLRIVPNAKLIGERNPLVKIYKFIDSIVRCTAVGLTFITVGMFLSLPIIFLQFIDNKILIKLGLVTPYTQYSERLRRFIGQWFMLIAGIHCVVEGGIPAGAFGTGETHTRDQTGCTLLTFTHASNLDGFLVAGTCPVRHYALAKKELFVAPFFSWLSLAIGGVPVDRNNRERAISALQRSIDMVQDSQACIVVAPEGTRSTSGQLLPFKKGPFYMWEELKNAPTVPMLLIGTYDLHPVGKIVNDTGVVVVRYLKPIQASEAKSRDDMLRLLRRRMLNSLLDCPKILEKPCSLSWLQWLVHVVCLFLSYVINISSLFGLYWILFNYFQFSTKAVVVYGSVTVIAITVLTYMYYVYGVGGKSAKKSN